MGKKPLTVTDDFDAEISLLTEGYRGGHGITALSIVSHTCYRVNEPSHLAPEVTYSVYITLIGSSHRLHYKTRESAKIAYDILMKAAERAD